MGTAARSTTGSASCLPRCVSYTPGPNLVHLVHLCSSHQMSTLQTLFEALVQVVPERQRPSASPASGSTCIDTPDNQMILSGCVRAPDRDQLLAGVVVVLEPLPLLWGDRSR